MKKVITTESKHAHAHRIWFAVLSLSALTLMGGIQLLTPIRFGWGWWVTILALMPFFGAHLVIRRFVTREYLARSPDPGKVLFPNYGVDRLRGLTRAIDAGWRWMPYSNPIGWLWLLGCLAVWSLLACGVNDVDKGKNPHGEEHA